MSLKTILVASAMTVVAAFGVGCGGNDCDVQGHFEECFPDVSVTEGEGEEAECTDKLACQATCFNDAPCDALTGKDADGAKAYADCAAACK